MKLVLFCLVTLFVVIVHNHGSKCGCKSLRPCYAKMLEILLDRDEAACIEDAAIGASTVTIFLTALKSYCGNIIHLKSDHMTYQGRQLYEVILTGGQNNVSTNKPPPPTDSPLTKKRSAEKPPPKPVIIIEAGQQGGTESVGLALFLVEQLLACQEHENMLRRATWVVLPCTNPDGQEYSRYSLIAWKKNLRFSEDKLSYGVDLTRNFNAQWGECEKIESGFSPIYPGPKPDSENETIFIKSILRKYKDDTKVYLSIKRDGHSIYYPYGYKLENNRNTTLLHQVAGNVATRVNQRAGGVHLFENMSLYEQEGAKHCGHSVDFAYDIGIPLSYEMRVFLGSDNKIMSKFQQMPKGYETSMRNGYFSGIREIFDAVTNEKKYGKI